MALENRPASAATLAPELPAQFMLATLLDEGFVAMEPIAAIILAEDGQIIAEVAELNEFGFGDTPAAAIADLQRTIAELYLTLSEEQYRLGPDLKQVWEVLQTKVARQ